MCSQWDFSGRADAHFSLQAHGQPACGKGLGLVSSSQNSRSGKHQSGPLQALSPAGGLQRPCL